MKPFARDERESVTGLLTRGAFSERLAQALPASKSALLFIDVDHLAHAKAVLKWPAIEALLRRMADELQRQAGEQLVGRWGGDEFVVHVDDASKAPTLAESLRAYAEATFAGLGQKVLDGSATARATSPGPHVLTFSIGIAYSKTHASDAKALLEGAEAALLEAKAAGRNTVRVSAAAY